MTPLEQFRDVLLRQTVAWCRENSPYYQIHFADVPLSFKGLEDLATLPILFRETAAAAGESLRCGLEQPACIQYTTGTTGHFFPLYRSREEVSYIANFFSHILAPQLRADAPRPLCLALTSAYHGTPTPVPCAPFVLSAGVYDKTQVQQARRILEREYALPGVEKHVSIITGGDILIKTLTASLVTAHFDFTACHVRSIFMTGGHVSVQRKRTLSQLWGAAVIDRYSMSEVFGGAVESSIGGPWVFDPEVIPEVVDVKTRKPITKGTGTLVLTGLYPFMQMMPMIRYYTGDIVDVVSDAHNQGTDLRVRFLGRERRSLFDRSGEHSSPLILSAPVHDILEDYSDIAVTGRFADNGAGINSEFAGKLHYDLEFHVDDATCVGTVDLALGLRYAPWLHQTRVTSMLCDIRKRLYDCFPLLCTRVRDGSIKLRITPLTAGEVAPYNAK